MRLGRSCKKWLRRSYLICLGLPLIMAASELVLRAYGYTASNLEYELSRRSDVKPNMELTLVSSAGRSLDCYWDDAGSSSEYLTKYLTSIDQPRIPPISSIFQGCSQDHADNLLLVNFNACSPQQTETFPSHTRALAMVRLWLRPDGNDCRSSFYLNILAAQKAGYIGVLFFPYYGQISNSLTLRQDKLNEYAVDRLFIPALTSLGCCINDKKDWMLPFASSLQSSCGITANASVIDHWIFYELNFSVGKILVHPKQSEKLIAFKTYLTRLYWWFLPGPFITLIWLWKTKRRERFSQAKLHIPDEPSGSGRSGGNATSISACLDINEATPLLHDITSCRPQEESAMVHTFTTSDGLLDPTHNGKRCIWCFKKVLRCTRYIVGLTGGSIVALPLGISTGGLAFTRLDENNVQILSDVTFVPFSKPLIGLMIGVVTLSQLWSPIQAIIFFAYSRVQITWSVENETAKIIRCSWFKSAVFLLVLGIIVPLCLSYNLSFHTYYLMLYNSCCTISNCIFLLVLNKHSRCTLFVFHFSVCMICAYIESSVVVVVYFMLNSVGSLDDLKTTALRTAEIYAVLGFSFQTSMHIIRKLQKPNESLFSSLGES